MAPLKVTRLFHTEAALAERQFLDEEISVFIACDGTRNVTTSAIVYRYFDVR